MEEASARPKPDTDPARFSEEGMAAESRYSSLAAHSQLNQRRSGLCQGATNQRTEIEVGMWSGVVSDLRTTLLSITPSDGLTEGRRYHPRHPRESLDECRLRRRNVPIPWLRAPALGFGATSISLAIPQLGTACSASVGRSIPPNAKATKC